MLLDLARQEEVTGDVLFLYFEIAGKLNDFHTVLKRSGDIVQRVRRGDEEHLRQVVVDVEIVVVEGLVLLGVEYLQQGGRGIAPVIGAHLVDSSRQNNGLLDLARLRAMMILPGMAPQARGRAVLLAEGTLQEQLREREGRQAVAAGVKREKGYSINNKQGLPYSIPYSILLPQKGESHATTYARGRGKVSLSTR